MKELLFEIANDLLRIQQRIQLIAEKINVDGYVEVYKHTNYDNIKPLEGNCPYCDIDVIFGNFLDFTIHCMKNHQEIDINTARSLYLKNIMEKKYSETV